MFRGELSVSGRVSVSSTFIDLWDIHGYTILETLIRVDPPGCCHTNNYRILKCPRESQSGVTTVV